MQRNREVPDVADHGGSLKTAERLFPNAPAPWVDLSTGINPHAYPVGEIPGGAFTRLPEAADIAALTAAARAAYHVGDGLDVVAAPGTQILLPLVMALAAPGRAAILSPTYAEHARAAALVGHEVIETPDLAALGDADLAVVVNPNNPDGRIVTKTELLALAKTLSARGGMLVVDEAFMDVGPSAESLTSGIEDLPIVVLRSFGKFFGLAGLRLGFAVARPDLTKRLADQLGPWAISGPALIVSNKALADGSWQSGMRAKLARESARLDALLHAHGVAVTGGTTLFRLISSPHAPALFEALGQAGILVRRFAFDQTILRFGLPGTEAEWARLEAALGAFAKQCKAG